jgi:predicted Zn-dependent protease
MKGYSRIIPVFLFLVLFCYGCATTHQIGLQGGLLPDKLQSAEQKMLKDTKKFEEFLDKSGAIYRDVLVENYINEVGLKMVPQDLNQENIKFNFKVIKDPTINAFAMPHGRIYVTTGLLSNIENEAQLAFILGHEISHVLNRDLLYFTESFHNKTVAAKVFDLVLTPATVFFGLGGLTESGINLIYAASVSGYGREQEARADSDGFKRMIRSGYRPSEANKIFDIFISETEKYKVHRGAPFLSSHPSNVARKKALGELLNSYKGDMKSGITNDEKFRALTKNVKIENVSLNIKFERYQHALDNLTSLLEYSQDNAQAHFYLGECYRLMSKDRRKLKYELNKKEWTKIKKVEEQSQKDEWQVKAESEYKLSISYDKNYAEPYRGLGFLYEAKGNKEEAISCLEVYLKYNPNAKDRRFVKSYIDKIKKSLGKENEEHESKS